MRVGWAIFLIFQKPYKLEEHIIIMEEKEVGQVFTYFSKIEVAAVKITGKFKAGDTLHFKGHTTDFTQKVSSMQIEGKEVKEVKKGDDVGIKVTERVRPGDLVYLAK